MDILFVTFNRQAFTEFSFDMLIANTDWSLVDRLVVWDDYSTDGTLDWLRENLDRVPKAEVQLRVGGYRSPVAIMNRYIERFGGETDLFAKIDNDIVVPPGWLNDLLRVMDANPKLELLGMEAAFTRTRGPDPDPFGHDCHTWEPCSHIGGVGLMRTSAFLKRRKIPASGRFGFTQFQEWDDNLQRGWITPDLHVACLDQIPFEPWRSLSVRYVQEGWQREWPTYGEIDYFWEWWPDYAREAAA